MCVLVVCCTSPWEHALTAYRTHFNFARANILALWLYRLVRWNKMESALPRLLAIRPQGNIQYLLAHPRPVPTLTSKEAHLENPQTLHIHPTHTPTHILRVHFYSKICFYVFAVVYFRYPLVILCVGAWQTDARVCRALKYFASRARIQGSVLNMWLCKCVLVTRALKFILLGRLSDGTRSLARKRWFSWLASCEM